MRLFYNEEVKKKKPIQTNGLLLPQDIYGAGDSDIEGAIRELEEEIGIKATKDDLRYLFTVKEQYIGENMKISHFSNVYLLFKNIELSDLELQKEEVSEVKHVYYKDFEKMLVDEKDNIVKHDEIYAGVLKELHTKFDK